MDNLTKKNLGKHWHFKHEHKPKEVKVNLNNVLMGIAKFAFYVAAAAWFIKELI